MKLKDPWMLVHFLFHLVLLGADITTYTDNTVSGNKTFNYRVRALGAQQKSGYLKYCHISYPEYAACDSPISNKTVAVGGIITFNVDAADVDGDVITLSQTGMPSFGNIHPGWWCGSVYF
ncbi:MAG: hypothetical protein U5K79_19165 [Cyclobacteriaceae bacterium]|nr:hypothetical protein [Cyclobacteriaceae bacterium]